MKLGKFIFLIVLLFTNTCYGDENSKHFSLSPESSVILRNVEVVSVSPGAITKKTWNFIVRPNSYGGPIVTTIQGGEGLEILSEKHLLNSQVPSSGDLSISVKFKSSVNGRRYINFFFHKELNGVVHRLGSISTIVQVGRDSQPQEVPSSVMQGEETVLLKP